MKTVYSIFSGTFYDIAEKDIKLLDLGQVPLTEKPKANCKTCFGRGHMGRDTTSYIYNVCNCVRKKVDMQKINPQLIGK
jgi:hypothetical protein